MLGARHNDDDDDIKSKIDDVQQISRCQLCDDKVENLSTPLNNFGKQQSI